VVASYRASFLTKQGVLLATARAGNVIGGGDWSEDRLIPDAARAAAAGKSLLIRSPDATRPWQHVLDALHGYLLLAEGLLAGNSSFADAWNFGPDAADNIPVAAVLNQLQQHWPELAWHTAEHPDAPHEASMLYLDSSKARHLLGWRPRQGLGEAIKLTADWYRTIQDNPAASQSMTEKQIDDFLAKRLPVP
jgi:CDP-glucose 4,6-dehydratase